MCLLVGFNISNDQPYVKAKFPPNQEPPTNIEYLVFPSKQQLVTQTKASQNYTIVHTDEKGGRIYGYCRRVIAESSEECLALAYCLTSDTKAPGFYFKVLKEIESRHGHSEAQMQQLVNRLQMSKMPEAGKFLHMPMPKVPPTSIQGKSKADKRLNLDLEMHLKWLTEVWVPDKDGEDIMIPRRKDIRLESTELSDLFEVLDAEMLLSVFESLLQERKVILHSENMSLLSSSILALDSLLYPFQVKDFGAIEREVC
jgi:DENN domain-containing protein 2